MKIIFILVLTFIGGLTLFIISNKDPRPEYSEKQKNEYLKDFRILKDKKLNKEQKQYLTNVIKNYESLTEKRRQLIFKALNNNKKDMDRLDALIISLKNNLLKDNYELSKEDQMDLGYFTQKNVIEYLSQLQSPVLYRN